MLIEFEVEKSYDFSIILITHINELKALTQALMALRFFRWWDLASSAQQQKASDAAAEGGTYSVIRQGADDCILYGCL